MKLILKNHRCLIVFRTTCLLLALVLFSVIGRAQGGPGGGTEPDPDLIPVDGGLGLLLAAGVGYGVKKARDYRKGKRSAGRD